MCVCVPSALCCGLTLPFVQVVMCFQGEGEYSRPLVITREENNQSFLDRNFQLDCSGKVCAKVLEDEMYMAEILDMAEALNLMPSWRMLPIHMIPTLNIHWEYGICYPVAKYCQKPEQLSQQLSQMEDDEDDDAVMREVAVRLAHIQQGALFLHPERFSMMLWIMDKDSRERVEEGGALEEGWVPRMILGHEFSVLPFLYPHSYPRHNDVHKVEEAKILLTTGCKDVQVLATFFLLSCRQKLTFFMTTGDAKQDV